VDERVIGKVAMSGKRACSSFRITDLPISEDIANFTEAGYLAGKFNRLTPPQY
jgi:hypothetical protein